MLLCDNFLAFKKIMVSKNRELEIAAVQAENVKKGVKISAEQQKINELLTIFLPAASSFIP